MRRMLFLLSILFAALPPVFGVVRALTTGSDARYLWVAFATCVGAAAVMVVGKGRGRAGRSLATLLAMSFVCAVLLGLVMARLFGVRFNVGMLIVVVAFSICWVASWALDSLSIRHA